MNRLALTAAAGLFLILGVDRFADAHCEVPCGIFADQARFEAMLEDTKTIDKAMKQIQELAKGNGGALGANQAVRWVMEKESHAKKIQKTIAQYFMAQRIKPAGQADAAAWNHYVDKLTKAHAVMRLAMKSKQTVDPANAAALRQGILDFHKAYESKGK